MGPESDAYLDLVMAATGVGMCVSGAFGAEVVERPSFDLPNPFRTTDAPSSKTPVTADSKPGSTSCSSSDSSSSASSSASSVSEDKASEAQSQDDSIPEPDSPAEDPWRRRMRRLIASQAAGCPC